MMISRRSFVVGAASVLGAARAFATAKPVLRLSDYMRGPGPQTEAIRRALNDAIGAGATLAMDAGSILIDDDIVVEAGGVDIVGAGETTRIVQITPGRGFLQLRGDGNRVAGFRFSCEYQRGRLSGRYRGYGGFQRVAAVWLEGGGSLIEGVSAENSFNTVCLRGPVVAAGGGEGSALDYTRQATGNRVKDISGRSTDFVLTGNQQGDLDVDGVSAVDTTDLSVPPHAVYMQNPGSTTAFCGFSRNVRLRNLRSRGNPYGLAFKISDIRGLTVSNVSAEACAGGIMISTTDGATLEKARFSDLAGQGQSFNGISVSQSNRVAIRDCEVAGRRGEHCTGLTVYHGSRGADVVNVAVQDDLPERSSGTPFRVADTSEAHFSRCSRTRRGADRPMFVVGGRGDARIVEPECRGSAFLLQSAADATVQMAFDPAKIDNYDPARSIRGRGRVQIGVDGGRQGPSLFPGAAGDASCPT